MKKYSKKIYLLLIVVLVHTLKLNAQVGYYDAPYTRYEADLGVLSNANTTSKSYNQDDLQCEATDQVCVDLSNSSASVEWTLSADGDGLVVRYSVPDGESGVLDVYADNVLVGTLDLTSHYSWEYLATNGNPNNNGITNLHPRMRFDEVRMLLPAKILSGGTLRLERQSGSIHIDFAELESVPVAINSSVGDEIYTGDGSDLQAFIDANGGSTIYLPAGVYDVNDELYFGVNNTVLKGAGMWHSQIHFTYNAGGQGGLKANASNISYSDLYLTTVRNSRSSSYKAINGVYTSGSTITNIWAEHFECGAWIGQYNTGSILFADGFTLSNCRFRNNYADGINLCKGTRNAIVEHCSFRNNGDDDMAIWSANGLECQNNTYRYNTSENCWRSAGVAIYGGLSNSAHHLLIKDNLEVGIKVNNSFSGVGFNNNGMHQFHDITIIGCGTFNDLFNSPIGAIDIVSSNIAGLRVKNVKFKDITILDSKNDAIYIHKKNGEGFYNLIFENITIDGTGKEFPFNNVNSLNWGRGYGILFVGNPSGYGYYCNMTYTDRGGNAITNINNAQIGTFSWTQSCIPDYAPTITSLATFGICDATNLLTADASNPPGNTVDFVEFFVDNISIGQDNSFPYSFEWGGTEVGNHDLKVIAHYLPSASPVSSSIQTVKVADGIYASTAMPTIDGIIDEMWSNHNDFQMNLVSQGSVSSSADLSAYFKITRDNTNLYILVDVTDDILRNDGAQNWQKDGIELYIDMGNDKAGSYVADDDFQFNFVWNINTPKPGLTYAQTTKSGNVGYVMEIQIPWTTLGGAPADATFMGIDVHVEDNDSGTRNGKKAWADGTDVAWQSTTVLGELQIGNCNNIHSSVSNFLTVENRIMFYPNPFNTSGILKLNFVNSQNHNIAVKDLSGKQIEVFNVNGNGEYVVGENLPRGMYLIEIEDGKIKQTIKLIKL